MLRLSFAVVLSVFLAAVAGISQQATSSEGVGLHDRQQDIVTWDDKSVLINGERLMLFSAEFHFFRLPVPSLWLDILQKIKAMGFNCVSFYVNWGHLEAKPGDFQAEGIFSLEPLFEAAMSAGVYLFARPGPYINAEVTGGGFPGWLQRVPGALRTGDAGYLEATENYTAAIGRTIADAQITNGGPVILFQQENEYVLAVEPYPMPDFDYWNHVKDQFKDAGIRVPWVSNEAWQLGAITPTTPASVDIYGFDAYPLGFDCWNPTVWPENGLPTDWLARQREITTTSPFTIVEFQGGGFQPWGGAGFDSCAALLNHEFQRVLFKNNYAMGITIFNVYMTWGGTNWGNLGHSDGYTSYDYGALITEERLVNREKYSEAKLQAHFFHVSPAYLEAQRHFPSLEWTDNDEITVTPATTNTTKFYIARHTDYRSTETTPYRLKVQTASRGNITVPQLHDNLVLPRRDSKIHVSDYPVGEYNMLYSSAEVFTWKQYSDKTVLVLYGGENEYHELAVDAAGAKTSVLQGPSLDIDDSKGYTIIGWNVTSDRSVVQLGEDLFVYLLNRNEAYDFWVPAEERNFKTSDVIVKAGYLIRNVEVDGSSISFKGDVNSTTSLEIIGGAPQNLENLIFNGKSLDFEQDKHGVVTATVPFDLPSFKLPCLSQLPWKYLDSLPEIQADYSDDNWPAADLEETYNIANPLRTPTSLYGGDYGFHTGSLVFRGNFTAKEDSEETVFDLFTQGGNAYGTSVWLGDTFVGSWIGNATLDEHNSTFQLPHLKEGSDYVLTVVMDHMGMNGNWWVGEEQQKNPRGILNYQLSGYEQSDIRWKITGNLGGEDYIDRERGPQNEGGLFAERQGYHWPKPPSDAWADSKGPTEGIDKAGIAFYSAQFDLDLPEGYEIPLSFTFANTTSSAYRAQIFVNGFQYGKFIPHIGPQLRFPIPEGILNYRGENHLAITLWAMEEDGARIGGMKWEVGMVSTSGFGVVEPAPQPVWEEREGAY